MKKVFLHYKEIQRLFPELYCMFYNHANKTEKITVKISPQNKKKSLLFNCLIMLEISL